MRRIQLVLVLLLSLGASPAFATSYSLGFSSGFTQFISTGIGLPPLDPSGEDVISFIDLPAGTYDFRLTVSLQDVTDLEATFNGQPAAIYETGIFSFASFRGIGSVDGSPLALVLTGTAAPFALYSGELVAVPVPEPGTCALLLAGLTGIGAAARRR